jgi:hypothetical protein
MGMSCVAVAKVLYPSSSDHLRENLAAEKLTLPDGTLAELNRIGEAASTSA